MRDRSRTNKINNAYKTKSQWKTKETLYESEHPPKLHVLHDIHKQITVTLKCVRFINRAE